MMRRAKAMGKMMRLKLKQPKRRRKKKMLQTITNILHKTIKKHVQRQQL